MNPMDEALKRRKDKMGGITVKIIMDGGESPEEKDVMDKEEEMNPDVAPEVEDAEPPKGEMEDNQMNDIAMLEKMSAGAENIKDPRSLDEKAKILMAKDLAKKKMAMKK